MFEEDESCIERLNVGIDLNVIRSEEAADGIEITFGKGGPKVLLLSDDLDGCRGGVWRFGGLSTRLGEGRDREECGQEEAHGNYVSAFLLHG